MTVVVFAIRLLMIVVINTNIVRSNIGETLFGICSSTTVQNLLTMPLSFKAFAIPILHPSQIIIFQSTFAQELFDRQHHLKYILVRQ